MTTTTAVAGTDPSVRTELDLIDTDVHCLPTLDMLAPYMPQRWADYGREYGLRTRHELDVLPALRPFGARADSTPPNGIPGSDPEFSREQLLDRHGIDVAILNNTPAQVWHGSGAHPLPFTEALQRANNDWTVDVWFGSDPRWRSAICSPFEDGEVAALEIARCAQLSDRFAHILLSTRTQRPLGNQKYWPIYEAAVDLGLPLGVHPGGTGLNQMTGSGWPTFYFENHAGYPHGMLSSMASMIFEGVFDRWPELKVVVIEGGWSWVVPFAWRLDASWRVLSTEVPHLERRPSEYVRDHFWFTTQPMEEPERPEWFGAAVDQLDAAGLGDRLMFSSDYPHWDYDDPQTALPKGLSDERRHAILAGNATALYGFGDDDRVR